MLNQWTLPNKPAVQETFTFDLKTFAREAWGVLEPATPMQWNWHHDAICEHLEAVIDGKIRDLLINVPPRCTKSILCSIMFPAWVWGPRGLPWVRWLTASYAADLATDLAVKTRQLINSGWYQLRWGHTFKFVSDQNVKTQYENDKTGYRIAVGVGGSATGRGADILICDDPNRLQMAGKVLRRETIDERDATVQWWKTTMSTRRNDPKKSARIVIQQRVHEQDVSGSILEGGDNYVHLRLPMEFDPAQRCRTFLGARMWEDPRERPGGLLWGSRFGEEEVAQAKRDLGSSDYSAVHQQAPTPVGGGLLKITWFQRYTTPPDRKHWQRCVISLDTAQKAEQQNDPWAFTVWAETKEGHYLIAVVREWFEYPMGRRQAVSLFEQWRPHAYLIEDKGNGTALIQEMRTGDLRKYKIPVKAIQPESDKVTRMATESAVIEAGLVYIPEQAAWLGTFEVEVKGFPKSARHDDQVDSMSQYLRYVRERPYQSGIVLPFRM